jgi:hypothetical protein
MLDAEKRAGQVGVDHPLPVLEGQILERNRRRAGPGIVEQKVQTARTIA